MESVYYPIVVQAVPGDDYTVYAYFTDGRITHFDLKPLISGGGVFSALKDLDFFTKRLTVMNNTIAWDVSGCFDPTTCIDVDPFILYEAVSVNDPLSA